MLDPQKKRPILRPSGRAMGYLLWLFVRKWPRYNDTALYQNRNKPWWTTELPWLWTTALNLGIPVPLARDIFGLKIDTFSEVTWASWRLNSHTTRLFFQQLAKAVDIKDLLYWPIVRGPPVIVGFYTNRVSNTGSVPFDDQWKTNEPMKTRAMMRDRCELPKNRSTIHKIPCALNTMYVVWCRLLMNDVLPLAVSIKINWSVAVPRRSY